MDPQSQSFTPYSSNNDTWRLHPDLARIQQVQAEHSDRISRLERRQDDDARMKSVWGQSSPFPSVLSGGTPQQAPLQHPPADHFRSFDDEANNMMSSLHLDAEDEPRRGMGATSRANSVRFDETANQNHFTHSSRPSVEFMSRTSSGLGGLQMAERSNSHKSEGRASSQHSIRSVASGRANSLNLDTTYGFGDHNRSGFDAPGLAPGLLLLGSVPSIIRCWMNTNFKHDALLYAAVCTGSYKSFLDLRLIQKLGFDNNVTTSEDGIRTVELPVYFPEAVPHPASSRSSSPVPQLPSITVDFQVVDHKTCDDDKGIQIFLGSDVLRSHSADILFSSNSMTLFDDDRSKLSIPLVRPENEAAFKNLFVTSGVPTAASSKAEDQAKEQPYLNGFGQGSSGASVSSATASPPPNKYRPPGAIVAETGTSDISKSGVSSSEGEARPNSGQSATSRPTLSLLNMRSESQEQPADATSQTTPLRSGSSPAVWSNWRRDGGTSANTNSSGMDWASASKNRETSYQRKETGIKVLKPKTASRAVSSTAATSSNSAVASSPSDGKSRFFDEGRRKSDVENKAVGAEVKESRQPAASTPIGAPSSATSAPKTKPNPIGGGSAFSWLNSGGGKLAAPFATASSQKKRKLAPFAGKQNNTEASDALYDTESLNAHAHARSSSPQPPLSFSTTSPESQAPPSPTSSNSNTTRGTTPPRFIPPHLHEEVLPPRESEEVGSPSPGAFAQITIDGGSSVDMAGSDDNNNTGEQRQVISPGRVLGARSASPAKRSAADMEGDKSVPGSFTKDGDGTRTDYDEAMRTITPAASATGDDMDTQETVTNGVDTSGAASMTTNTSATSLESEAPPPYSVKDEQQTSSGDANIPTIDEQVKTVYELTQQPLDEGQAGYLVAKKWLSRVLSRTSENQKNSEFPKEARDGDIGQVDNSDLVPQGAFTEPLLKDMANKLFIPLKPGLTMGEDFEVLPEKAWGLVLGWYGNKLGQKPIIRYAHNTAPLEATLPNIMYEINPPVITIRKVSQPKDDSEQPPAPKSSVTELRLKDERKARGQMSPDDAITFVSSRTERFNKFLIRSKEAAGIPLKHKVRVWKIIDRPRQQQPTDLETGVLSPPESRSSSPPGTFAPMSKLALSTETFSKMEISKDLELIDAKDDTDNPKYNGKSDMHFYQLFEDARIILEEMIGGPAGGEFVSDKKKNLNKFLSKTGTASKPGSAAPSGRTSPAPTGPLTRGRQRRDGRTRGVVGLTNLGNTCYMNSALQCIRSIEELALFFLSDRYKKEINSNNPLGHGGAMAKQYGNFLNSIYGDSVGGSFTPSAFRKTLGSIQPMFSGYGQQDSQEFLSFLIDALHEDLNRIVKKPYNENPDSDDKTVHDPEAIIKLGEIYRANHKARNDSVAMDLFSGFYKNTMECPVCDKISITFDPYSLLTVQLPIESTFQHTITFIPLHGKPVNHNIDIDKNSTIKTLKEYIASKHAGVTADRLWMAEVYSHKLYKVFDNFTTLAEASIQTNDYLFIFELEAVPSNLPSPPEKKSIYTTSLWSKNSDDKVPEMDDPKADQFAVPVFSRQKGRFGTGYEVIMHPMYITVTREEAKNYDVILKKVLIAASRMTSRSILAELDEDKRGASTTNGDMAKVEAAEENVHISDRSVPSEDGMVEISVDNPSQQAIGAEAHTNGVPAGAPDDDDDRPIPPRFMEPDYYLSASLRNSLFALNYATADSGGLHCTGMSGFAERSVRNMFDRVKQPARRGSTQSESSGEESTTSTGSGAQANGESEESDEDEANKPDLIIGESSLALPNTPIGNDSDEETLPDQPWQPSMSRKGRRNQKKHGKNNRQQKMKTYSRKGRRGNQQNRPDSSGSLRSTQSHRSLGGKSPSQDDNQYYIKLGEGIVIDWIPDALDALFGSDIDNEDDERGVWLSHQDGKNLPLAHDPEVEAKRKNRETRRKHGITLEDCFKETGKREVLSEDNAWYCNRCKEMRRAAKTLEIWTIPDILVVHLKRFGGNRSFRDKIDVFVDYPIEGLNMTERIGLKDDDKEYMYDLFAVDNHYGGLGGGHYTAMAKNFYDGQWYDYNDTMTNKVSENRVHSAAAYLLFYRRRSDKPLGPPALQEMVLEARNPQAESAAEETAEESDAGEGQLGGPNGSRIGSSSGLIGAGAGAMTLRGGDGGTGAGTRVGSNPMTRTSLSENPLDDLPVYGPQRPADMMYGNQGSGGWDFNGLNDTTDDDATRLIDNIDDQDDDAASTVGQMDTTDSFNSFEGGMGFGDHVPWSAAQNTPVGSDAGEYDQHELYSNVHELDHEDTAMESLHLADAGNIGGDAEDEEAVEIYPDPPDGHEKMD